MFILKNFLLICFLGAMTCLSTAEAKTSAEQMEEKIGSLMDPQFYALRELVMNEDGQSTRDAFKLALKKWAETRFQKGFSISQGAYSGREHILDLAGSLRLTSVEMGNVKKWVARLSGEIDRITLNDIFYEFYLISRRLFIFGLQGCVLILNSRDDVPKMSPMLQYIRSGANLPEPHLLMTKEELKQALKASKAEAKAAAKAQKAVDAERAKSLKSVKIDRGGKYKPKVVSKAKSFSNISRA